MTQNEREALCRRSIEAMRDIESVPFSMPGKSLRALRHVPAKRWRLTERMSAVAARLASAVRGGLWA
jgi:hypothetical protein